MPDLKIPVSSAKDSSAGFSGKGFNGIAIHMLTFVNYLANELRMPVADDTGLTERYDIKTENVLRSKEEVLRAIDKIGLKVEQAERTMPVLIIY